MSPEIEQYITDQSQAFHSKLNELYEIVRSCIPAEAEELISYQIPCFKYHYLLVGFGVKKDAVSLYTMNPELVKSLKEELKTNGIKAEGSTIYFNLSETISMELIRKIIDARVLENVTRYESKNR